MRDYRIYKKLGTFGCSGGYLLSIGSVAGWLYGCGGISKDGTILDTCAEFVLSALLYMRALLCITLGVSCTVSTLCAVERFNFTDRLAVNTTNSKYTEI